MNRFPIHVEGGFVDDLGEGRVRVDRAGEDI